MVVVFNLGSEVVFLLNLLSSQYWNHLRKTLLILIELSILSSCRVTFIIAFLLLLTGAAFNDQRGEESMYPGGYCYIVKPGVFSGGALMSLASVALGIVYYVALSSSKNVQPWDSQQNQGIAMGHPQIPPRSTEPVFVHEDTHNRLQVP